MGGTLILQFGVLGLMVGP